MKNIVKILNKLTIFEISLFLLSLFQISFNLLWISLDKNPLPWDQAGHTLISLKYLSYLIGENSKNFLTISGYYPPFVHIIVALLMMIFGPQTIIGPIVITGFFITAIWFLYFYTVKIFNSKLSGVIAAFIFSFLPVIYGLSRFFLLEIPVICLVLICFYLLEEDGVFLKTKKTLILSIFLGLSLMTKWVAAVYLFTPFLLKVVHDVKIHTLRFNKIFLINLGIGITVVLTICLPWYVNNFMSLLNEAKFTITPEQSNPHTLLSLENFKFYLLTLINFQLTWVGAVILILAVIDSIFLRKRKIWDLVLSIVFIYIVFTLIGNKNVRYTIMIVPLSCIILAYFLAGLLKKKP